MGGGGGGNGGGLDADCEFGNESLIEMFPQWHGSGCTRCEFGLPIAYKRLTRAWFQDLNVKSEEVVSSLLLSHLACTATARVDAAVGGAYLACGVDDGVGADGRSGNAAADDRHRKKRRGGR